MWAVILLLSVFLTGISCVSLQPKVSPRLFPWFLMGLNSTLIITALLFFL